MHEALPPEAGDAQLELARTFGDGWRVPPIPAEVFNVNTADRAWVDSQCTPQSLATFQQPLRLTGGGATANQTYIFASDWGPPSPFAVFYEQAKAAGWRTGELACGHDVMVDEPAAVAQELLAIAAA